MKIGIFVPSLNAGGAERTAVSLANWIAENSENNVYLINLGINDNCYSISGKVNLYNKPITKKNILSKCKTIIDLIKYLKKIKLDVSFEMLFTPMKYILLNKIVNRKMVIIGSERNNPKERYKTIKYKILYKLCPILCNGYIFQTNFIKKMFSKKIQQKSIIIPNAISNPDAYRIVHTNSKDKIIVSVGRLAYQKGYDNLIKAFKILNGKYPDYKLVIYGDDDERNKLEDLVNELNLKDKVFLPGKLSNVMEKVSEADIFVMSSRYEGFPNALLEAMAIGMPCISTNCVAGPSDIIINNYNGILVEVDNIKQLSEKIIYLIEHPQIKKRLGEQAKKIVNNFSTDIIYAKYLDYFKNVYYKKKYKDTLLLKIFRKTEKYGITNILSDKLYLKIAYRLRLKKRLNLRDPKDFNEKLQWLKIYDRNSLYTKWADKYNVRDYIKSTIGEEYLIPVLGIYNSFDEIDFKNLPNKFVIKCNHDSGGLVICKDKSKFDYKNARKKITKSLKTNFYYHNREWPYKNIKPLIIIEKYMEDENCESLRDYKFYCFNGKPKYLYVSEGLENHLTAKISFFDMNYNFAKFGRLDFKKFSEKPEKPVNFKKMQDLARKLSADMPFLRVDFYEINKAIYFGELTFTPCGGFMPFEPEKYDRILGDMIKLKNK